LPAPTITTSHVISAMVGTILALLPPCAITWRQPV
jgi:hypothetical protein